MVSIRSTAGTARGIRALKAQARAQQSAIEKLSSGRRINRASDDAAGLGISVKLRSRIRSELMAQRNVQYGLSAVRVAEGGLSEIQELVHRLNELAVQAASDTITDVDRGYIQEEVTQTLQEISALAETTKFNGKKLLSRHRVDVGFVIDASGSMNEEINQVIAHAPTFKSNLQNKGFDIQFGVAAAGKGIDNKDATRKLADIGDPNFAGALAQVKSLNGSIQDPYSSMLNASGGDDFSGNNDPDEFTWRKGANRKMIHITDVGRETALTGVSNDPITIGTKIAGNVVEAHIISNGSNKPISDAYKSVASSSGGKFYDIGNALGDKIPDALNEIESDLTTLFGEKTGFEYQVGPEASNSYATGLPLNMLPSAIGLEDFSLATKADAQNSLAMIKTALDSVSAGWAKLGALASRFTAMDNQLATVIQNETQAVSRIEDADIAQSTSELSRTQVLSQSAVSVLAQAQQFESQFVLRLLGGL